MSRFIITFNLDTELTEDELKTKLSSLGKFENFSITSDIFDAEHRVKVGDLYDYVWGLCQDHYNPQVSWEINGEEGEGDEDEFYDELNKFDHDDIIVVPYIEVS